MKRLALLWFGWALLGAAANYAVGQAVDEARVRSAGIRTIESRHLVLHTDLPTSAEVDRLPAVFDLAVPQWAEYFGIDLAKTATWRAEAFLIGQRRRFDALGLMPVGNDQFINGISIGSRLWLYDQPTAYYRRHLLLHEGTHAFMATFLGGCGPGWYMEGMAELMSTHRLDEKTNSLTLRVMPHSREEMPMWGRVKLIRDACAAGRALAFPAVMLVDNRRQLDNESYSWTWAAAKWLDAHPRYRDRFRALRAHVLDTNFNEIVRREFARDWADLNTEWQAYIPTLDYGYDFARTAIDFQPGQPLTASSHRVAIAADRGWQSSGVLLEAGRAYQVAAAGRYEIAADVAKSVRSAWPCEPGGVTIEYHEGRPLGMLLGAVVPGAASDERGVGAGSADSQSSSTGFAKPFGVGLGCRIQPAVTGTLYLRVNDSGGQLGDNKGSLTVTVAEADTPAGEGK